MRTAARRVIEEAGGDGGLLVAPAHVIERDVPWDNVVAFVEAVQDFGVYR